jgi:Uma2 family endonuclease
MVPPGQRVALKDISWQEFEEILQELGEKRNSRIAYSRGVLEIVTPLPEHEVAKVIVGDLIKILLQEMGYEYESLGSTTFRRQDLDRGIEPDDCFYIEHYQQMIGKERIDLTRDPPPDLALEIDITSKTQLDVYAALGIKELWRVENRQLRIDLLQDGEYVQTDTSPTFPNLPIAQVITDYLTRARTVGNSKAVREFRQWLRSQL